MADSDFGQLWAELVLKNGVSPQLRQIVEDLKLVDASIKKTRDLFSAFDEIKLSHGVNELEKNWRSMRGAIADVRKEISSTQDKMKILENAGLGDTAQYNQYRDKLMELIKLRNELLSYGRANKNASMMGSEDISRFKSEFQVIKKEIGATDAQAKHLVDTQRQNVAIAEKMVAEYARMAQTLSGLRQNAIDSGFTAMGTQWLQNTVNQITNVQAALQQALSNPKSITSTMMDTFVQQFERISQKAAEQATRMRDALSAKTLMGDSETALTKMEAKLKAIENRIKDIRNTPSLSAVDTSGLEAVQAKLDRFIQTYRNALSSGNFNNTIATQLARQFRQISAEAQKAGVEVDGFVAAEQRRAKAARESQQQQEQASRRAAQAAREAARQAAQAAREQARAVQEAVRPYDQLIAKMQQMQNVTTRTGRIWEQFKTQLAFTAFSIYGIENFLKSIITIGGEFERQRVALQNMLGDMREANELFGQTKALALESPFTFRQLSTYTKQLAAFSIPYEELFDTNKRLSDMSAGLGVDMSRLILAYGQVRAATVLRGQELRQFTEAGVPMVEKLADYFTQLNGELVTTKDIFKMISAKQVPFEAVRAVMREMTDEGGMFYDMQAKIADTLSGRWGNLKDAWEIMLGSLADGQSLMGSLLKYLVEGLTKIIRNLTTIAGIIGGLGIGKMISGLGFFGYNAIGGTFNIDKFYLKSKNLQAIELQRAAMTRQLSMTEREILVTKGKITAVDRATMIRTGQLDKYQTAMLMKSSQLTRQEMMRAALKAGMTKEEIRQLAAQQQQLANQSKSALMMGHMKSKMGDFFGGVNWAGVGITAGIMAVTGIISGIIQKYHDLAEEQKSVREMLNDTNKSAYEFLVKNPLKEDLSGEEAVRAIEKYDDELKKAAPNYLEIKSKIVGEHGESPQEQAFAYRDALQDAMNGASIASTKGTSDRIINKFDLLGWVNLEDMLNDEARHAKDIRENINALSPNKIMYIVDNINGLDEATKKSAMDLVMLGKKIEALKLIAPDGDIHALDTKFELGLFSGHASGRKGSVNYQEAEKVIGEIADVIRNEWSEYFKNGKFDENHEFADAAKSGILQVLRDAVSKKGMDSEAADIFYALLESMLFDKPTTYINKLAAEYTEKNANRKDEIINALKDGNLPDDIKNELMREAILIGESDDRFREQIDKIFENPVDLVRYILIHYDIDTSLEPWQEQMIADFGEKYTAVIKAAPDIPSAIDAINKLYKESKEKMENFRPLMLRMGIQFTGGELPKEAPFGLKAEYRDMYAGVRDQVNGITNTLDAWSKNQQKYGLTEPQTVAEKKKNKKGGGGKKEDKELQAWRNHVDLYKKFLDQYRDLTKMWGEKKALDKLRSSKSYEWLFDFAGKNGVSVTDIEKMNEKLSNALDLNKGDKQKRKEAMAKRIADLEAEGYKRAADELKRTNATLDEQLKILNEQYDAYKKIFIITGNKEGAMQLAFGGQVTNERYIDDLTSRLKKELSNIGSNKTLDEVLGMSKEDINTAFGEDSTAADLINKLKEERNKLEKEYLDLLATALSSDMSLEDKRAEAQRKHNEQLEKLIKLREKDQKLADEAIEAENNRFRREDAGYEQQIFERDTNMSGLINNADVLSRGYLRAILVHLRDSLSKYANDNTPEGIDARKKLEEQILKVSDALDNLHDHISDVDDDFYTGGDGKRYVRGLTATRYHFNQDQEVDPATEERVKSAERFRKLSTNIDKASKAFKALEDVLDPVIDLLNALGMEDTQFGQALSGISNALSAAGGTAGAFSNLTQVVGADSKLGGMLSAAGPYGAAAAAALSVATTIFQMHDKALQKEIEASQARQKEFEDIASNLEKVLERTLGSIYTAQMDEKTEKKYQLVVSGNGGFYDSNLNFGEWLDAAKKFNFYTREAVEAMKEALSSGTYYDANKAAILAQRDEIQHQLDLEKKKKKSDDSVISDLQQKLIEMDDLVQYYAMDMAKELYEIDIKSWSQSIAEALVDAWAKGEDAVEAYKNKVKDIMRDLAVNIVSKKFIETLMKPVEDFIAKEMEEKSGKLDEYSIATIADMMLNATQQATDLTYGFLDELKNRGLDLSDTEDNASTLGKGISNITEDTADLLASYLNAIRADVAALRALEERIVESGFADTNATLMLQLTELRNISAFAERNALAAERILDLFDSVTTVGSNGRKVRV